MLVTLIVTRTEDARYEKLKVLLSFILLFPKSETTTLSFETAVIPVG
jgi:hypothetical protein